MNQDAFLLGRRLAELDAGVPAGSVIYAEAGNKEASADDAYTFDVGFWNKTAYEFLCSEGDDSSDAAALFKAAAVQTESPLARDLARVSFTCLGQVKSAAPIAGRVAAPVLTRFAAMSPAMVQTILAGSVGAGAALGAGIYTVKRHTERDDADIEALKARIANYNNLSRELQQAAGNAAASYA